LELNILGYVERTYGGLTTIRLMFAFIELKRLGLTCT